MSNARHAKPASPARRILTCAGETLAVLAVLALAAFGMATAANASTTPHATVQHTAGRYPTRGYARTCRAFARWDAAGIPSWAQLRTLAHSAARLGQGPRMLPNDLLQADVAALVLTVIGHTGGSRQAVIVAHDCRQD